MLYLSYTAVIPHKMTKGTDDMNENVKAALKKRAEKVISALEKNNMKGYLVDTPDEAKQIIKELIKDDKLIVSGGTMTLKETGIQDFLNENYSGIYIDREKLSTDEVNDLYRKAFSADTYFASTNAITEYGELYNVDGTGNGSQSGQDFYDYIECFHGNDLQNFLDSGADLRRCDFYTPSITNVVKKSNT